MSQSVPFSEVQPGTVLYPGPVDAILTNPFCFVKNKPYNVFISVGPLPPRLCVKCEHGSNHPLIYNLSSDLLFYTGLSLTPWPREEPIK